MEIANRHVFITGAAKRLGRALAEHLLESPIRLTAHYHTSHREIETLKSQARGRGRECFTVAADLTDVPAIQRAVEVSEKALGPIDVLIHSASAFRPMPTLECDEAYWDEMVDSNLKGSFFLAQAVGQRLLRRKSGVVIFLGDVLGEKPIRNHAPFQAAKAGLLMLMRTFALEWAPSVRVNAVSPGTILPPESASAAEKERWSKLNLFGRAGMPSDIVAAVKFLIENDYVTGMNLRVDGGRSL